MKSKVICLIFAFNFITMNKAPAFFQRNDHSENWQIEHTLIEHSTQGNNALCVYDNFIAGASENYFIKKKEKLISIDQLRLNLPLNILIQDSIYPENSIDRMMLANLRAKKLFDEYSELQKKIKSTFQDEESHGKKKDGQSTAPLTEGKIDIEDKAGAIQKAIAQINYLGYMSREDAVGQNPIIFEHLESVNNEINFLERDRSYSGFPGNAGNEGSSVSSDIRKISRKENRELPWVLRGLLKLFNFIISNKIEIALSFLFTTIIAFFVSLKIKK